MSHKVLLSSWDGGLIERAASGRVDSPTAVRLARDVVPSLRRFVDAGYACIVVTNQPGLPADGAAAARFAETLAFVSQLFASQGITLADVRICRHAATEGCDCRKPGVGLVNDYVASLDHDASLAVGDEESDLGFARNLGIRGFRLDADTRWTDVAHAVLDRPRQASVHRRTKETDVVVEVDLDRSADAVIETGIGFFDHMLEQLGKHGGFALEVRCRGDLEVDEHHTIEDVALALGQALEQALGDKRGIGRYGFVVPMDEAAARAEIDLGGRAYFVFDAAFPRAQVGGMPTELVEHFFRSLSDALSAAIHLHVTGSNTHHMIEACFKSVARALRMAIAREGTELPTTKGRL
jgi:imidazoleglycerol-phosphate dehydratase / histidinol-phosphatase